MCVVVAFSELQWQSETYLDLPGSGSHAGIGLYNDTAAVR